jgi:DNA-binding LytR/AlgR family response regulator
MSGKLKLALLEDSAVLLKDLKNYIEDNRLGEVAIMASDSEDFLKQFDLAKQKPDALLLDIDLAGDTMTGVDVANHLNLPVFFISGKTKDYLEQIQALKLDKEVPVEFMTKPISSEKLVKLFDRFEKTIKAFKKTSVLNVKVLNDRTGKIEQENIMFITSIKGSESNNKLIQLYDDIEPLEVSHMSLGKFFELGLSEDLFVQTSQSCIVNKKVLKTLDLKRDKSLYTYPHKIKGEEKSFKLEITEKYWSNPKRN